MEGHVKSGGKYAVYSCTTTQGSIMSYAYSLPLTALAWRRIGFGSIVLLIGDSRKWKTSPVWYHVYSNLRKLDCVIIFLNISHQNEIMLSQTARMFAANLLPATDSENEPYLITADADIWPIDRKSFLLPKGKAILSLNSACCGNFKHGNKKWYTMLPMSYIGMYPSTWKAVTKRHGMQPNSMAGIVELLQKVFGDVVLQPVNKGKKPGWYLDQRFISVLIFDWLSKNTDEQNMLQLRPGFPGKGRIDRSGWKLDTIEGKNDSHILKGGYRIKTWPRLEPLLKQLHSEKDYAFCKNYTETFRKLLKSK